MSPEGLPSPAGHIRIDSPLVKKDVERFEVAVTPGVPGAWRGASERNPGSHMQSARRHTEGFGVQLAAACTARYGTALRCPGRRSEEDISAWLWELECG